MTGTAAVYERLILVAGFLGGISFTALVPLLQSSYVFEPIGWGIWGVIYFDALITMVAGVSVAFILSSIVSVSLAAGTVEANQVKKRDNVASNYFIVGWLGLLIVIPLLLVPIVWVASLIVGILEIILFRNMFIP